MKTQKQTKGGDRMTVWIKEWRAMPMAVRLDMIRLTVSENLRIQRQRNALLAAGEQPRRTLSKGSDQFNHNKSIA